MSPSKLRSRRGQFYLKQKLWFLTANYKETDTRLGFLWLAFLDDPPASKGTSKYSWLHVQTADPPMSFSLLWFLGSLRSSSRDSACFRSKFDLSSRFILILICPRGELRQKYSMIFKGIFQKCGRGGRAAQRFVFHAYNFANIFTEDFTGVFFL